MAHKSNISPEERQKLKALYSPLGILSGRIGDVVFRAYSRKVKGRKVIQQRIASRPKSVKVNQRKDLKANRTKFSVTNSFASYINRIDELKQIWANHPNAKKAYNVKSLIHKCNGKLSGSKAPAPGNIILPPSAIKNRIGQISLIRGKLCGLSANLSFSKNSKCVIVFSFDKPKYKYLPAFRLTHYITTANTVSDAIELPDNIKKYISLYKHYTLYAAVIEDNFNYTNTIVATGKLSKPELKIFPLKPTNSGLGGLVINKEVRCLSHSPPFLSAA